MIIRGLFIVSLLMWVVALDELLPIFVLTCFSIFVLLFQGFKWAYLLRSLRLLMWIWVPTLLFHGLFTPGTLIQEPIYIPLSIEGVQRGLYLVLHITLIFFVALLAARMFSKREWAIFVNMLPTSMQARISIILLMALKSKVEYTLQKKKEAWQNQGGAWKEVPQMMVNNIQDTLQAAKYEAKSLWDNWEIRMSEANTFTVSLCSPKDMVYLSLMLVGWGLFWMV